MNQSTAAAVALVMSAVAAGQEHSHNPVEKLGTVTSRRRAMPPRRRTSTGRSRCCTRSNLAAPWTASARRSRPIRRARSPSGGLPLSQWGNPFGVGVRPAATLRLGSDAVQRARTIGSKSERERLYVDAVARLYEGADGVNQPQRLAAYRDSMAAIAAGYPDDDY